MIRLDYRDARPIYEQVRDGLRSLMVTGVLAAGEKLPSVRSLATELAINPNTIQRAYSQLETEGYVYTVSGRGTFVCEVREQKEQAESILSTLGIPASNAINMFYKQIILQRGLPFEVKLPSEKPVDISVLSETGFHEGRIRINPALQRISIYRGNLQKTT